MVELVCFSLIALGGMSLGAEVEILAERNNDVLGVHSLTLAGYRLKDGAHFDRTFRTYSSVRPG